MPGIFDFIGSLFGGASGGDDPFGGSSGGFDFGNVDPNQFSVGDAFGGAAGGAFGSVDPSPFNLDPSAFTGGSTAFGGGSTDPFNFGGVDPNSFALPQGAFNGIDTTGDTPLPLQTNGGGPNPVGQLVPGTGPVGTPGGAINPTGLISTLPGIVNALGGGGGSGTPATGAAKPLINQVLGTTPGTGVLGSGLNLGQILGTLGLAGTALSGPPNVPGIGPLQDATTANQNLLENQVLPTALANQQGQISGTALNQFERALQQKEAGIRQAYAGTGESGSTMEAQDLAGARDATTAAIFTAAQQMASTGLSFATSLIGADNTAMNEIMQAEIAQDKEYRDAMAAFAAAAAGTTQQSANATTTANG